MSVADGPVKYELIHGQFGTSGQVQKRQDADVVQGTALAQMLPDGKLKFEVFPGKAAGEVAGFTVNARLYER